MEDEPLLHPRKFDDLVLEYLFGDGHRESFPNMNPRKKTLNMSVTKVRKSTITGAFPDGLSLLTGRGICPQGFCIPGA
jgi:hypothetical protein